MDHRTFVTSLFHELLRREPNEGEISYWSSEIQNGTPQEVYFHFVNCQEYRNTRTNSPKLFVPPGHFYSPIVDPAEILKRENRIFSDKKDIRGIDLREQFQIAFVDRVAKYSADLPFTAQKVDGLRYFYKNNAFAYGDAIVLATMLREFQPRRLIEVGSGYSSALMLDVNELFLDGMVHCAFIDPYTDLVKSLVGTNGGGNFEIIEDIVQDIPLAKFRDLKAGDILFIDSTHIVKTGSDVLHHIENILPSLASGVIIHFHDICYPFEYPRNWVIGLNLSWNEVYYLRAFLTDNPHYEILFFNNFMARKHPELMRQKVPLFMQDSGSSFWFRKL